MINWEHWIDKRVYVITRKDRIYTGVVKDVDAATAPIIWITMVDKYGLIVQFTSDEIAEIKEERELE